MKVLIITGDNYDDSETLYPYYRLLEEGYTVDVAFSEKREIRGKYHFNLMANKTYDEINVDDYAALFLPGGMAPEKLRIIPSVVSLVQKFHSANKPIGAICHGPQLLISAGILRGKTATCYPGLKDDIVNAGALYKDEASVCDGNLITARRPCDLPYIMHDFMQMLKKN